MKKTSILLLFCSATSFAQSGPVAAGTSTAGAGGSISYSIGQIDYTYPIGAGGNSSEGLQQPYELFVITGTNEVSKGVFLNVFPNPSTHQVILDFKEADHNNYLYELRDANSKIVQTGKISESKTILNVLGLNSGVYFLNITSASYQTTTFKLIKH